MLLRFICGCQHEIHTNDDSDVGWWKEVATDRDGFLICATHRVRRHNYASLPQGDASNRASWEYARYHPLELEQHFVFGKPLPVRVISEIERVEDRRDNRDPQEIGQAILAAASAKGNGHNS